MDNEPLYTPERKPLYSTTESLCAHKDWVWALEQIIYEAAYRVRNKNEFDRALAFSLEGMKLHGKERSLQAKLIIGALPSSWGRFRVGESRKKARKRANARTRKKEKARRIIEEVALEFPF